LVPAIAIILSGCAATTRPPRFSSVSPADPAAPEAATTAPSPVLTGNGEFAEAPEGAPSHEGHAAAEPAAEAEAYTCPMHPQVAAKAPGSCPICGMTLVKKAAKPKERRP